MILINHLKVFKSQNRNTKLPRLSCSSILWRHISHMIWTHPPETEIFPKYQHLVFLKLYLLNVWINTLHDKREGISTCTISNLMHYNQIPNWRKEKNPVEARLFAMWISSNKYFNKTLDPSLTKFAENPPEIMFRKRLVICLFNYHFKITFVAQLRI